MKGREGKGRVGATRKKMLAFEAECWRVPVSKRTSKQNTQEARAHCTAPSKQHAGTTTYITPRSLPVSSSTTCSMLPFKQCLPQLVYTRFNNAMCCILPVKAHAPFQSKRPEIVANVPCICTVTQKHLPRRATPATGRADRAQEYANA